MSNDLLICADAIPTKHFAVPPFKAVPSGGNNRWWYVENGNGINCLTFKSKPGAVFASEAACKLIAEKWNKEATPQ